MKKITLAAAIAVLILSCSRGGGVKLRTDTDSVAYVLGMNVGANLLRMDSTLNVAALCQGIADVFDGAAVLTPEEAQAFYLRFVNFERPEKIRAYEDQFLNDIATSNRSYARTTSGLTYTVEAIGDEKLTPNNDRDTVAVRYRIAAADGRELFSSYERGDTLRAELSGLLKGMQESVRLIGKGGRICAWIPAAAAYGAAGDDALGVGPNATLYFEIELVDVDRYADRGRR